jgi:Ca2+-binding EF-hand superfamily protein
MARIRAKIARDGVRLQEFFIDFDKLRKGTVGEAAFRTCLGTLNLGLSPVEINGLVDRYQVKDGTKLVNYRSFINEANTVFSDSEDPSATIAAARSTAVFTDNEKAQMIEAMNWLHKIVTSHRMLLKPAFKDFDKSQCMHITQAQFLRVLKQLNLMPPNESIFECIIRNYCDRGNSNDVNYFKFCKDVDRPEDMFPAYVAKRGEKETINVFGVAPTQ